MITELATRPCERRKAVEALLSHRRRIRRNEGAYRLIRPDHEALVMVQ